MPVILHDESDIEHRLLETNEHVDSNNKQHQQQSAKQLFHGWLRRQLMPNRSNKAIVTCDKMAWPCDPCQLKCPTTNNTINIEKHFDDQKISLSAPCTPKFMMKRATDNSSRLIISPKGEVIDGLQKELVEKDKMLTELRLELLSTEDQIEELREAIGKLAKQLVLMREENKRLSVLIESTVTSPGLRLSRPPSLIRSSQPIESLF